MGKSSYYVDPTESGDTSLGSARQIFFGLLAVEAPEVLDELREQVRPGYQHMVESFRMRGVKPPEPRDFFELYNSAVFIEWLATSGKNPEVQSFESALREWINRHQLDAEWLRDAAIRTLQAWEIDPGRMDSARWYSKMPSHFPALTIEEREFKFALPYAWEPTLEPRAYARKTAIEEIKTALDQWLDQRAQLAEDRGFVPAPDVRKAEKHTRWLIRYQVIGKTCTAIASEEGLRDPALKGRQTVTAGVQATATRLGINLRSPSRGGRPRNSRTQKRKPAR